MDKAAKVNNETKLIKHRALRKVSKRSIRYLSQSYNPPTCKVCGSPAAIYTEADGACGDPDCCPQTSHIEILCANLDCPILSEPIYA
jgi:hypothetical protein